MDGQVIENPRAGSAGSSNSQSEERARAYAAAGIVTDAARVRANHRLNAISIFVPMTGTLAAIALLPVIAPTAVTWSVFLLSFLLTVLGGAVGLHRYFTHRSFKAGRAVVYFLGTTGSWAMQGPIARWVADHRRHHRFSDERFDPHSPYWNDEAAIDGRFKGWTHAHFFWMLRGLPSDEARYARDVTDDAAAAWCDRHYWLLAASGIGAPILLGYALGGAREALLCGLWAGFFRTSLLQHITWSVNSFGHMFGAQVEDPKDQSRNNAILTACLLGEGLHSYHHAHPNSAVNRPIRFDPLGLTILGAEKLGLVRDVKRN